MDTFAEKIIKFNEGLNLELTESEVQVLNPFTEAETRKYSEIFYSKYYNDQLKRSFLIGINPGRFGAGLTGVCFVDPVKLENACGIANPFPKRAELSSDFIFKIIAISGGVDYFFSRFLLTAVCPLGFVKDGKNINYYDDKQLLIESKPFIVKKMKEQIDFGANRKTCICIGEGTNYRFLSEMNIEYRFFNKIIPLAHPRFILQYKRKKLDDYVLKYKLALEYISGNS